MKCCFSLVLALTAVSWFPSLVAAQAIQLNRYSPAPLADDGLEVSSARVLTHLRAGFSLHLDYAHDPLVLEREPGNADSEFQSVVSDQVTAHLGASLGLFDRATIFAGLQLHLLMTGEAFPGFPQADGTGIGDLYLGGRYLLLTTEQKTISLAIQATLVLPTAQLLGGHLSGQATVGIHPEFIFEVQAGPLTVLANAGLDIRGAAEIRTLSPGSELTYGASLSVDLVPRQLSLSTELIGSLALSDFGVRTASPLEALFGGRFRTTDGWNLGAALGVGILRGYGTPDLRGVFMFGRGNEPREVIRDEDGDGIVDPEDSCPTVPEDFDHFEDHDGCPELDNDLDTIVDELDECISDPEDLDGFEDADGCPDSDNDGDGIVDASDNCPDEAEDPDGFEDEDGCPDLDNDSDSVPDVDDNCPIEPGPPSNQGCPEDADGESQEAEAELQDGEIVFLGEAVLFSHSRAELRDQGLQVLRAVRRLIHANGQIQTVRIEGHTSREGRRSYNQQLSVLRARIVLAWLVEQGIDPSRLVAVGCGESYPARHRRSERGRRWNRRVDFWVLESENAPDRQRCTEVTLTQETVEPSE